MGMSVNLDSTRIVYTLGLWAPGRLGIWKLGLWMFGLRKIGPLKLNFTFKGAVAYYDIFNSRF